MTSLIKKQTSLSSLIQNKDGATLFDNKTIYTSGRTFDLVLGVFTAAIAFPLISLTIVLSVFFSDATWEEFWDKFLEI